LNNNTKIISLNDIGDLTYPYQSLDGQTQTLNNILEGNHEVSKEIIKSKKPIIIIGESLLRLKSSEFLFNKTKEFLSKNNKISDEWNSLNILSTDAATVGNIDLGIINNENNLLSDLKEHKFDIVYLVGQDNLEFDKKDEFIIYQGSHGDKGAESADIILPGAAYTEQDGYFTNLEGKIQKAFKASYPPGEAKEDWWITNELGKRMGLNWKYKHPKEIYEEMSLTMPSLNNISWERLENENSVTYPSKSPTTPGDEIVFGDKFPNENGKGKFVPASVTAPDEVPDKEFAMILTTGRQLEHWHTGAMTRKASNLDAIEPEPSVSISPKDIIKNNMKAGDKIKVTTRRGSIDIRVRQDRAIPDGVIFIPFCYNESAANLLTNPALDPYGKIPEFKYCAAKIEKL